MKKILLLAIMVMAFTSADMPDARQEAEEYVYICTGPSSKRYHKTERCKGLRKCSDDVIRISKSQAINQGKTPCKICY
ncbi:MAG: hypothetical protein IJ342_09695 [Muribaculaceae bacterium]|nr:hypothetical protein [Muribaculaceae bacterium]